MSVGRDLLDILTESLKAYLAPHWPEIVYERYRVNLATLEQAKGYDIRIGMYEADSSGLLYVSDWRANQAQTGYGIEISVSKAYFNDDAAVAELQALDIRDHIIEWAKETDFAAMTGAYLNYFSYRGHSGFTRNPVFVTVTMSILAQKDLYKDQTANVEAIPPNPLLNP